MSTYFYGEVNNFSWGDIMSLLIDELMLECKRKGIKITQKDLAEAAGIGQTAIHKIVRGDTQAPKPQIPGGDRGLLYRGSQSEDHGR